eukprot:SAG31_NODE_4390_length_3277_cov_1.888609_3_plen_232_part_00
MTSDGAVETIPHHQRADHDCFHASSVSLDSIEMLRQSEALKQRIRGFKESLDEFFVSHGKKTEREHERIMQMDPDRWETELRSQDFVRAFGDVTAKHAKDLLAELLLTMRGLYTHINDKADANEVVDFDSLHIEGNFALCLSGSCLVPILLEFFKDYLFRFPCVLFGGPICFFGEEIFLAVRCSFRLVGIIATLSNFSGRIVYSNLDWVTNQVWHAIIESLLYHSIIIMQS